MKLKTQKLEKLCWVAICLVLGCKVYVDKRIRQTADLNPGSGTQTNDVFVNVHATNSSPEKVTFAFEATNSTPRIRVPVDLDVTASNSSFFASTNPIPIHLVAPTGSVSLHQDGDFSMKVKADKDAQLGQVSLVLPKTNLQGEIKVTTDEQLQKLITDGFKIKLDASKPGEMFSYIVVSNRLIADTNLNILNSYKAPELKTVAENKNFPLVASVICIVLGGMIGRAIGIRLEEGYEKVEKACIYNFFVLMGVIVIIGGLWMVDAGIWSLALLSLLVTFVFKEVRSIELEIWKGLRSVGGRKILFNPLIEFLCGVLAALLVPAFARMAMINPLVLSYQDPLSSVAFFALCVIAGLLGWRFITGVFEIFDSLVKRASVDVKDLESKLQQANSDLKICREKREEEVRRQQQQDLASTQKCKESVEKLNTGIQSVKDDLRKIFEELKEINDPSPVHLVKSVLQPPPSNDSEKPIQKKDTQ